MASAEAGKAKQVEHLDQVVIRFAGDSGDGMQLTGDRFTSETAVFGNDLATLPDFPAEIRAPAGSLPGVSGFQLHFADHDILTPGDQPNVLVAMNPAALKVNLADLLTGRSRGRSASSRRSSHVARRSRRRTVVPSGPAGTTERRPRTSPSRTRSLPRSCGPARIGRCRGTRRSLMG